MTMEHPTDLLLEQFMRCELTGASRRLVVRHLVAGCDRCRETTGRLWALGNEVVVPQPRVVAPAPRRLSPEEQRAASEVALMQRRHEMLRAGLGTEVARLSFELALRYRQEEREEELAALAGDVVPILSVGELSGSVAAALLVFRRLAETNSASEEFLREAVRLASPVTGGHTGGGTSPRE